MKKKILNILIATLVTLFAEAQGPARCLFNGNIRLESNDSAVVNAQIYISSYEPKRGLMDVNWTSSFTDAAGNFAIDLKGASNFMRVIRAEGDTIDLSLYGIQCNTRRDIKIALPPQPMEGCTYVIGDVPFLLNSVTLEAYGSQSTIEQIPATVGYVSKHILESNDQSSLQPSLNTIAGVMMESRGYGGSHRLNIRGSSLRSPFAVRNVKMYLDGIPLTGADGQTPLELIDAADLQSVEVIKGPAGSMYGSGNGGVLLLKSTELDSGEVHVNTSIQAASFGGYRWNNSASAGFKTSQLRVSHNWQEYDGYRQQEFNRKQQVTLSFKQRITDKQQLSLWGTFYEGNWGLPGALNQTQADTFPQQAVPFSIANNASLWRERWVGAISQSGKWGRHFDHFITLNYHHTDKSNPYGTSAFNSGYKDENSQSLSGRAVIQYKKNWNELQLKTSGGAEWQTETYSIIEQKIELGEATDFKYFYDIAYQQAMAFAQAEMNWKEILFFTGGLSAGNNEQFIRGRNAGDFMFDTTTTWGKTILPRIAFSIQPLRGLHLYRSFSAGASNPTVFEMIDQENSTYNLLLTPERGNLNEIGIKHHIHEIGIDYSITAYEFEITDAILPYSVEVSTGESVQRYHNAGSTLQRGLEWTFRFEPAKRAHGLNFAIWNNGTLNNHRFARYEVNETILNDNSIPGVPKAQMNTGLQLELKGFAVDVFNYWMDRMPLDNENTSWTAAYHLLNVMFRYRMEIGQHLEGSIHAGINNVLDAEYSSFLSLNAVGSKYYNPSAPRNYFGGLSLRYTL
jgi:iron complex outermembrane receptor protein